MILQSLSNLQREGPLWVNHGHENRTNGAYGSRSHGGHKLDRDERVRDGRFLDTHDMCAMGMASTLVLVQIGIMFIIKIIFIG